MPSSVAAIARRAKRDGVGKNELKRRLTQRTVDMGGPRSAPRAKPKARGKQMSGQPRNSVSQLQRFFGTAKSNVLVGTKIKSEFTTSPSGPVRKIVLRRAFSLTQTSGSDGALALDFGAVGSSSTVLSQTLGGGSIVILPKPGALEVADAKGTVYKAKQLAVGSLGNQVSEMISVNYFSISDIVLSAIQDSDGTFYTGQMIVAGIPPYVQVDGKIHGEPIFHCDRVEFTSDSETSFTMVPNPAGSIPDFSQGGHTAKSRISVVPDCPLSGDLYTSLMKQNWALMVTPPSVLSAQLKRVTNINIVYQFTVMYTAVKLEYPSYIPLVTDSLLATKEMEQILGGNPDFDKEDLHSAASASTPLPRFEKCGTESQPVERNPRAQRYGCASSSQVHADHTLEFEGPQQLLPSDQRFPPVPSQQGVHSLTVEGITTLQFVQQFPQIESFIDDATIEAYAAEPGSFAVLAARARAGTSLITYYLGPLGDPKGYVGKWCYCDLSRVMGKLEFAQKHGEKPIYTFASCGLHAQQIVQLKIIKPDPTPTPTPVPPNIAYTTDLTMFLSGAASGVGTGITAAGLACLAARFFPGNLTFSVPLSQQVLTLLKRIVTNAEEVIAGIPTEELEAAVRQQSNCPVGEDQVSWDAGDMVVGTKEQLVGLLSDDSNAEQWVDPSSSSSSRDALDGKAKLMKPVALEQVQTGEAGKERLLASFLSERKGPKLPYRVSYPMSDEALERTRLLYPESSVIGSEQDSDASPRDVLEEGIRKRIVEKQAMEGQHRSAPPAMEPTARISEPSAQVRIVEEYVASDPDPLHVVRTEVVDMPDKRTETPERMAYIIEESTPPIEVAAKSAGLAVAVGAPPTIGGTAAALTVEGVALPVALKMSIFGPVVWISIGVMLLASGIVAFCIAISQPGKAEKRTEHTLRIMTDRLGAHYLLDGEVVTQKHVSILAYLTGHGPVPPCLLFELLSRRHTQRNQESNQA